MGTPKQSAGLRELVVCLVVSVALFTWSCQSGGSGPLEAIRGVFQTVTMPVTYLGAAISSPLRGLGNIFANLTADQATLTELEAQVGELQAQNAELEERASSAERLQGLLDLQDSNDLRSTAAHVISGSTDSWSATVTLDKGSAAGLTPGMPVTSASGVVGQIISCSATTSTVRLLTDESSSISAMVQSTRAQGMLNGSASGEVTLELVSTNQDVEVGSVIVTSGLGGVFPKGLPIGEVASVSGDPSGLYLDIVVDLYADPWATEEVLVITSLTDDQRATAEDIAEADAREGSRSSEGDDSGSDE
ncbi:MAG: rod shape-determining protein MreC [Atopobiaceae bacterium]|nr:rod shape-determining protein MreC [Atopobiaceae bacterium]